MQGDGEGLAEGELDHHRVGGGVRDVEGQEDVLAEIQTLTRMMSNEEYSRE